MNAQSCISVSSTKEVDARHRFQFWNDMLCSQYVELQSQQPTKMECYGEVRSLRFGSLDLSRVVSNVPSVRRTKLEISKANHEFVFVHLCSSSKAGVFQGGRLAELKNGDLAVYESTSTYDLTFEKLCDTRVMKVHRARLARLVPNLSDLTAVTLPGSLPEVRLYRQLLCQTWAEGDELSNLSMNHLSDALLSCVAGSLQTVSGIESSTHSKLDAYYMETALAHARANLSDETLCLSSIASAVGISARHLSRVFEGASMSLMRTVWRYRLEACKDDLSQPQTSHRSVAEVAYSWGFNNQSHFCRKFREAYGMTPREWMSSNRASDGG